LIVLEAVVRIGKRSLKNNVMRALAAAAFVGIFFFNIPFPIIILARADRFLSALRLALPHFFNSRAVTWQWQPDGGVVDSLSARSARTYAADCCAKPCGCRAYGSPFAHSCHRASGYFRQGNVFSEIAVFFSKMAMVTSAALTVLRLCAPAGGRKLRLAQARRDARWPGNVETTPGPLIMVLQFVGFMAAYRDPGSLSPMMAGTAGACSRPGSPSRPASLDLPRRAFHRGPARNRALNGALSAITAAVVGVVLNLAIWFAIHTIFRDTVPMRAFPLALDAPRLASVDWLALALSVAAAVAIFRFKVGMIPTLAACCGVGLALYLLGALT
jgi:chromate transporter